MGLLQRTVAQKIGRRFFVPSATMAKKKIDPLNKKQCGAVTAILTVSDVAAAASTVVGASDRPTDFHVCSGGRKCLVGFLKLNDGDGTTLRISSE